MKGFDVDGRAEKRSSSSRATKARPWLKAGISQATYFNWKKKCAGLMPSEMRRLRELEDENGRLKKTVADLTLDREMLQDVIERKLWGRNGSASWSTGCWRTGACRFGGPAGFYRSTLPVIITSPVASIRPS